MKINKPIVFFDLETTGTSTEHDRIIQIATTKIHPDGTREEKTRLINPGIPIPPGATEVHGITDEMVANQPTFKQIANALFDFFFGCDLAGYNSNDFDIPLLIQEFHRLSIEFPTWDPVTLDGMKIETLLNPRTLSAVFERYTGKKLDDAHQADADVSGTLTVLDHQLKEIHNRFPGVLDPDGHITPEAIEKWITDGKKRFDYSGKCYIDDDGVIRWAFGKNKDKDVFDVRERGYLNWVLNANFPAETKTKLKKLLIDNAK